ncbi:MAG: GGDEF domain-containing phosphodiesterase [Cereibacter changlensis]
MGSRSERFIWIGGQLRRQEVLVFLPAVTLLAFWAGGERMLILTALGLPVVLLLALVLPGRNAAAPEGLGGLAQRPQIIATLDETLSAESAGWTTACLVVQIDDLCCLLERHGRAAWTEVIARSAERISAALRQGDSLAWLSGGSFAIALRHVRRLEVEELMQLAVRMQAALAPPIHAGAARLQVTCCVGFCPADSAPSSSGRSLLEAAQIAAEEARRAGPGSIRSYVPEMAGLRASRCALAAELQAALEEGQIRPWFQPQICTDTGAISGFEALARWLHPRRGLLHPADFLDGLVEAGLVERLGEVMLQQSLRALQDWDRAGLRVPTVGVNFSAAELRNPRLVDKLRWELDRFDLTPDRLSVEILETVVAETDSDIVVQTVASLARLGCGIDLDDFGTGHASIGNIRRFTVRRLKVDRSFISRVDEDRDQQRMLSAILSLAERLGLDTLAEGVETPGEHAMVAQLGCGHVQGFGIARPMPFEDTLDWIARRQASLSSMPRIGHRAG